jgi:predicted phosphodiesterase
MKNELVIGRRAFLRGTTLMLTAGMLGGVSAFTTLSEEKCVSVLKIGLVTDVHYADVAPLRTRFYRQSIAKLREGVERFDALQVDFIMQLGDLIDSDAPVQAAVSALQKIEAEFARFKGDCFYVFGNHDVLMLSKEEFLQHYGASTKDTFYSFDRGPFHFIVLDACFREDGQPYDRGNFEWTDTDIPTAQRDWLRNDLNNAKKMSIVFVHQRLDVKKRYDVKSASAVRQILEKSGRVLAVFQGHSHHNDYQEIGGIHYCTLRAVVEGSGEANNSYGLLNLFSDGSIQLTGFRKQTSYFWKGRHA